MKTIFVATIIFVFSVVMTGCDNGVTGSNTKRSLSNLVIPENLILTSYSYKGRSARKDSVIIAFDYNSTKISSFGIEGTLDSGKSWFPITSLRVSAADHEDFIWYPKNDSTSETFKFCDEKKCTIRVTSIDDTLSSNEFYLIGSKPAQLFQPDKGAIFDITDSLQVEFSSNSDLLSDIDVSFFMDSVENRVQFSEDSSRVIVIDGVNANIKKFTYYFPLPLYTDKFTDSVSVISVMISDYQQSGFFQITDSITIAKPGQLFKNVSTTR